MNNLLNEIANNWVIVVSVVGIIVTYARFKIQGDEHEKRICELEHKYDSINPVFMEIKSRLSSIEATLKLMVDNRLK